MIIVVVVVLIEVVVVLAEIRRRKEKKGRRGMKRNRNAQLGIGTGKILACEPTRAAVFFPPSLAVFPGQIPQTMNFLHQARRGCLRL